MSNTVNQLKIELAMNMIETQPAMELTGALTASEGTGLGPSETQKRNGGQKPIWVLVLVGLYALALLGVLGLFTFQMTTGERENMIVGAVGIAMVLLSQVSLLWVPVHLARRRPVRRHSLWLPLITSGALFALLVLVLGCTAACRLGEILEAQSVNTDYYADVWSVAPLALMVASWITWVAIYYRMSACQKPEQIALTLHRRLLQGSVLQLLICGTALAIPHDWRFAFGYPFFHLPFTLQTLIALVGSLCIGALVMFLALGPAVVMLYVRRCMDVRLTSENTLPPAAQKRRVLAWSILAGMVAVMFIFLFLVV